MPLGRYDMIGITLMKMATGGSSISSSRICAQTDEDSGSFSSNDSLLNQCQGIHFRGTRVTRPLPKPLFDFFPIFSGLNENSSWITLYMNLVERGGKGYIFTLSIVGIFITNMFSDIIVFQKDCLGSTMDIIIDCRKSWLPRVIETKI